MTDTQRKMEQDATDTQYQVEIGKLLTTLVSNLIEALSEEDDEKANAQKETVTKEYIDGLVLTRLAYAIASERLKS